MTQQSFPSRVPTGLILGVVAGLLSCVPCIAVWKVFQEPVRSYYLKSYLRASLPHLKSEKPKRFLMLVRSAGNVAESNGASVRVCRNSDAFLTGSAEDDVVESADRCVLYSRSKPVAAWLQKAVYGGQSLTRLLKASLVAWGIVSVCLVLVGGSYDARQRQRARNGIQLRGPDLISRWEFNRRVKGDGFPIVFENRRNLFELLRGKSGKVLRIRLRDENKNIITMSDPGGGKTSIMMQILDEVERRG